MVVLYPVTPGKRDDAVERVIQKLNIDYGLGIEIPDSSLSPTRRKQLSEQDEQYARWDRICQGIRFLYYQRDCTLDQALENFFNEATAASLRWVPKPRADPGTFPSPTDPPRAQTAGQQWSLQTILINVIDEFKSSKVQKLLVPKLEAGVAGAPRNSSDESDASPIQASPGSVRSKRSFDSDDDHLLKRRKAQQTLPPPYPPSVSGLSFASALGYLDNVPSRQRPGLDIQSAQGSSPTRRQAEGDDCVSVKTHGSSWPSSVFSQFDGQTSTQTTVEAGSQAKRSARIAVVRETASTLQGPSCTSADSSVAIESLPTVSSTLNEDLPPRSPSGSTVYSEFSDAVEGLIIDTLDQRVELEPRQVDEDSTGLKARLRNIWRELTTQPPSAAGVVCVVADSSAANFPRWLQNAPLAVAWEITRICLHCNVTLDDESLSYNPAWSTSDIVDIWRSLARLDAFQGKSFPQRPSSEVFAAALSGFECRGNTVVMSASLEFNPDKTGPMFLVDMKPLRLDEGCRLTRRFGPDRFLELLIPSPASMNAPPIVKVRGGAEEIIKWLTESPHSLVGRQWRAFYAKDAGYRKPAKELRLGPDAKAMFKERVHLFAETGHNFRRAAMTKGRMAPADDTFHQRTELKVSQMLDWLLQLEKNGWQPHLKLFSRIQLGLSKTFPAVTFEPGQIRHHAEDILSATGKVMNDGIGRMSRSVARKIRDVLGLSDIPSAIQGRMGSAKGMWLMDVADTGDVDWIETYPSQRKWECDFADPYHRTLEIRSISSEVKSAGLNLQFLPVLEARAKDPLLMRRAIGDRLIKDLEKQFENQKSAFKSPLQLRQWVNENSSGRSERVKHGHVPFLGGLPENRWEILNLLLNSGFDLRKLRYGKEIAWDLQRQRCDILKTKLNIKVGRSAYVYMVVDFWGVLEENEVHLGFSSKFRDESDGASYTLLTDCDVLVARSPAHFVSDVQKVRAVFKSELHALKDVIVFSSKGNIPLADKLSGGDYDGDMAWVCWDPDIVNSFVNAEVPAEPDLSAYMDKDKTTFDELIRETGRRTGSRAREQAVYDMISKSFKFAMQPNFLGICTNYKERLCYHNNSVSNREAIILSTLVGKLVDQSKQGIVFDKSRWERLQKELLGGKYLSDPAYKGDIWTGSGEPRHIIDYLKFSVAKPAIDHELEAFHQAMKADGDRSTAVGGGDEDAAQWWDRDLAVYYEAFKALAAESRSYRAILEALINAIGAVEREWKRVINSRDPNLTFPEKVQQVYAKWCEIEPRIVGRSGSNKIDPKTAAFLEQPYLANREGTGYWALLKASAAFKTYYKTSPKFVWQMAGRQLAFIKAQMTSGGGQAPLLVTPLMYAGLAPDAKFVKQYMARLDGDGSEYPDPGDAEFPDDDFGESEETTFRADDVD